METSLRRRWTPQADQRRSSEGTPRQAADQEHARSLSFRQEQQLRRIDAGVRWSDPHLAAMFCVFGRPYAEPSQHHTGRQLVCNRSALSPGLIRIG
jgi:hypothetical protein